MTSIEIRPDAAAPDEPEWLGELRQALRQAPDPERAARLASGLLEALPAETLDPLVRDHLRDLQSVLTATCGVAPFLATHLRRHPQWIQALVESDLSRPREHEELASSVDDAVRRAGLEPGEAEAALRRVKYFELARLTVRDASPDLVPLEASGVTLAEVSHLADALLDGVLAVAAARLTDRLGPPVWRTADGRSVELGFCVLGLGKLGSEELNYSSDVDLVYIHEQATEPLRDGPSDLAPADYFTRLARSIAPIAADTTVDGFLYRIDLDLRPEGSRGPIVLSDDALCHYYEVSADTWEKAAFMKARPVAGDLALGWRTIRSISPMIYSSTMDFASVAGIRQLKGRVQETHGDSESGFNVKIDAGGIRDLEFIGQAMQMLHGGRIPQLRGRSAQVTLESLGDVGLLDRAIVDELLAAYRFLRRVENRIQMREERQLHVVPRDPTERGQLARAIGYGGDAALEDFDAELAAQRDRVSRHLDSLGIAEEAGRIGEIFARNAPQLMQLPTTRQMMTLLADAFAREIEGSPDHEMALNNLDRFIGGVGSRSFYYQLLMDRPELVPRLSALFGASRFLSDILARHPRLIEPLFENPERLVLSRAELREDYEALRRSLSSEGSDDDTPDPEATLSALRLFHHRQIANVGLLDIAEAIDRDQVEHALTDIADECLEGAVGFARDQLAARRADLPSSAGDVRFLVVGMGKLGSREMSYGSDLDLIFIYDLEGDSGAAVAATQDYFVRLSQRLISALQTATADGACYEIDARMRPSGNQGTLVTSLTAFRRYHETDAQPWERQALLRARAVVGDSGLAADFETLRRSLLERPLPEETRGEIDHVRRRMETELAREGAGRLDFKIGRGGVLDVENVTQYLRLTHGRAHPDLLDPMSTAESLERLSTEGILDAESHRVLADGWSFLRRLSAGLRIVENRSISDLDAERGDLDGLARRLGYVSERRSSEARKAMLRDYRQHTESIRTVYERVFRDDAAPDAADA